MNVRANTNIQTTETSSFLEVIGSFAALEPAQQLHYGGASIVGILAVTLLIRSITELVKACKS